MKFIRTFLLILIIIGFGLLLTQKSWAPRLVEVILNSETPTQQNHIILTKPATTTASSSSVPNNTEKISGQECEKAIAGKWTPEPLIGGNGEYLKSLYATTTDAVYYYSTVDRNGGTGCIKLVGADSLTFKIVYGNHPPRSEWYWAKDKSHVYYGDKIVLGADSRTFEVIDYSWGKDKNNVYYIGDRFADADAATFRVINNIYVYDRNHLYQFGDYVINAASSGLSVIPYIDAATMNVISDSAVYIKDKNGVYIDEGDWEKGLEKINGADPSTFQILGLCFAQHGIYGSYAKDKNFVYCADKVLEGADVNSFQYVGELDYEPPFGPLGIAKDVQCIWSDGAKVLDSNGKCISPVTCTPQVINAANLGIANDVYNNVPVCGITPY